MEKNEENNADPTYLEVTKRFTPPSIAKTLSRQNVHTLLKKLKYTPTFHHKKQNGLISTKHAGLISTKHAGLISTKTRDKVPQTTPKERNPNHTYTTPRSKIVNELTTCNLSGTLDRLDT